MGAVGAPSPWDLSTGRPRRADARTRSEIRSHFVGSGVPPVLLVYSAPTTAHRICHPRGSSLDLISPPRTGADEKMDKRLAFAGTSDQQIPINYGVSWFGVSW